MIKKNSILFILFAILFCNNTSAQIFSIDNFKLTLDNYPVADSGKNSVIKLTKQELLQSKKLHVNFSWATIKSLMFYFSGEAGSDVTPAKCNGSEICKAVQILLKRCTKGSIITIVPLVVNKQNTEVDWGTLTIIVK